MVLRKEKNYGDDFYRMRTQPYKRGPTVTRVPKSYSGFPRAHPRFPTTTILRRQGALPSHYERLTTLLYLFTFDPGARNQIGLRNKTQSFISATEG
jgi:hypothetical protein